mmetsp:Transcript_2044/g.4735  ORF Transcript_2044/g.4735 Transcript_2044/m.4735 type:complete len:256 (+) Transcript_2044:193-960(+)
MDSDCCSRATSSAPQWRPAVCRIPIAAAPAAAAAIPRPTQIPQCPRIPKTPTPKVYSPPTWLTRRGRAHPNPRNNFTSSNNSPRKVRISVKKVAASMEAKSRPHTCFRIRRNCSSNNKSNSNSRIHSKNNKNRSSSSWKQNLSPQSQVCRVCSLSLGPLKVLPKRHVKAPKCGSTCPTTPIRLRRLHYGPICQYEKALDRCQHESPLMLATVISVSPIKRLATATTLSWFVSWSWFTLLGCRSWFFVVHHDRNRS